MNAFTSLLERPFGRKWEERNDRDPEYAAKFLTEFSDRIYYGTDVCSAKQTFRYELDDFLKKLVSDNMISKDTYEKIIRKNAIKLLKLEKE